MKTITVTITGEQGVGKSTLARILMNALEGRVVIESGEHVPFTIMDPEELELWGERLFANVKIVFKTEQEPLVIAAGYDGPPPLAASGEIVYVPEETAQVVAQRMYDHFIQWCRAHKVPAETWAGGSVLLNAAQPLTLRRQVPEDP